jgi:hypothetical protein
MTLKLLTIIELYFKINFESRPLYSKNIPLFFIYFVSKSYFFFSDSYSEIPNSFSRTYIYGRPTAIPIFIPHLTKYSFPFSMSIITEVLDSVFPQNSSFLKSLILYSNFPPFLTLPITVSLYILTLNPIIEPVKFFRR